MDEAILSWEERRIESGNKDKLKEGGERAIDTQIVAANKRSKRSWQRQSHVSLLSSANAPRSPGSRYLRHTRLRESDIVRALFLCNEQLVELSQ